MARKNATRAGKGASSNETGAAVGTSSTSVRTPTPTSAPRRNLRRPATASREHSTDLARNATNSHPKSKAMNVDDDSLLQVDDSDDFERTAFGRSSKGGIKKEPESRPATKKRRIIVSEDEDESVLELESTNGSEDMDEQPVYENEFDEEDEDNWEEVTVPVSSTQAEEEPIDDGDEELSGPWQYNAVEIVFDKPLQQTKKTPNRGITKEERLIRVLIHQTHLLCLIANGKLRNRWISHPKLASVALSLVPSHIAESVQATHNHPTRELNALRVLALWWKDSFVVTGPGIQNREYVDMDAMGIEAAIPVSNEECLKLRKNLQRRLLNRSGSSDVCSQLFTAICRALGLKARLIESLQACSFKVVLPKDEAAPDNAVETRPASKETQTTSARKGKGKKKEVELDESDTTRGSRVVIPTPHRMNKKAPANLPMSHRQADPPVFWTEVHSSISNKWIPIDPVRGIVNSPLKMHPPHTCAINSLAYVVAYDEENYVTDVTRRYTSQWGSITKKLRVQPAGPGKFDWWAQTMYMLMNPVRTADEDLEQQELLQAEISERMPTKLGDFNNHPIYALERHLKKFEILHPRIPVLGHIRGEAIYPRSCVKQVRSKENWLKRARQIKAGEVIPVKWVKSRPATILQMRIQQQTSLAGASSNSSRKGGKDQADEYPSEMAAEEGEQVPLFGEWQTEPYQPPWVVDGKVPRNQYGRMDVFTPAMVPIGGTHLKGRNIKAVARQLGVDYVEAVTGFEFQSRRSVPVVQGIIVPTECAEMVMDAYHEVAHHADQEASKRKRIEVLKRWRKMIKGVMVRRRLMEEYGDQVDGDEDDDKGSWVPDDDEDGENENESEDQDSQGSKEKRTEVLGRGTRPRHDRGHGGGEDDEENTRDRDRDRRGDRLVQSQLEGEQDEEDGAEDGEATVAVAGEDYGGGFILD